MSLHSIKDINALDDPLKQYQVTFLISNLRGTTGIGGLVGGGLGDSHISENEFELRCTSFSYPGTKIKTVETVIFNHIRNRATIQDKSGVWTTKIIEGQSGQVLNTIHNWCNLINNPLTGLTAPSELYTSLALVKIQGANGHKKQIYLRGLYPIEVDGFDVNASSSEPVEITVKWNYDWWSEEKLLGL